MAKLNYLEMKKADWQNLASSYGVEFKAKSTVRYLVEKIAEIIGVDDKIVDDEELKKSVCDKIYAPENKKTSTKKSKSKKNEEVQIVTDSKLALLRKECESLGLAWGEAHTESDLEQLLNAIKGAGITNQSIELDVAKFEEINDLPQTNAPAFNPIVQSGTNSFNEAVSKPSADPTQVDLANLDIYRKMFTSTIRNHFRVMGVNEIAQMFTQANYPFHHEIKYHPSNRNQIEIILTSSGNSLRVPSDNPNDWINVNG